MLREFRACRDSAVTKVLPFTSICVNKLSQCLHLKKKKKKKDKKNKIKSMLINLAHSGNNIHINQLGERYFSSSH